MRKILRTAVIVTVFLITMLALAFTASAGVGGVFLSAYEVPPNQVAGSSEANFDLWVTPGQTQEIRFNVRNGRAELVSVEIGLNTAITNAGGRINHGSRPENVEFDDSIQFYLDDFMSFPGGEGSIVIEIPGQTTAIVPITLSIPNEGFEGTILGGIHAQVGVTEEELAQGGMIVNRFANIMQVRLRIQDNYFVEPDFTLGRVDVDVVSAMSSFIARIHNPTPRMSMNALASMWIIPVGTDQAVFYHENMDVNFAPHSIFHFVLMDREAFGIFPGDYIARVRIEYDGRIWDFEEEITVTAAAARAVAEGAVGQAHMLDIIGRPGPSPLIIALISLAVLLLLAVVFLMLKMKNKGQAVQQQPPANVEPVPQTTKSDSALDKLKGMDEDKLAKVLEQLEQQGTDTDSDEK